MSEVGFVASGSLSGGGLPMQKRQAPKLRTRAADLFTEHIPPYGSSERFKKVVLVTQTPAISFDSRSICYHVHFAQIKESNSPKMRIAVEGCVRILCPFNSSR